MLLQSHLEPNHRNSLDMSLVSSLVEAHLEAMESTEAEEVWAPTKPVRRLMWVDLQGEVVLGWGDTT